MSLSPNAEYAAILEEIGDGLPNTEQYQRMSALILDIPEARKLARMDPFSSAYKAAVLDLYYSLRGRADQGYLVSRDELPDGQVPDELWSGTVPWSFRDTKLVSEHMLAWAHIFRHLGVAPSGSVLEYGPGTGQILLMLARMGYRAFGVDIDPVALETIRRQADHLRLPVTTERAEFGEGFDGQKFDCILFYEAFHHAVNFADLLIRLQNRLNAGGRIVLCGEPIVPVPAGGIPYPWGPRLDAMSVFCIRRFGWMELGFTHDFLVEIARRTGWAATLHSSTVCGRAIVYVLERTPTSCASDGLWAPEQSLRNQVQALESQVQTLEGHVQMLENQLVLMHASTSWRVTSPLRASKRALAIARQSLSKLCSRAIS